MTPEADGADAWIETIRSIPQYQGAKGVRAPYKPLLLLWLIGQMTDGHGPEFRFEDARSDLGDLLEAFRVGATRPKPEHPFVYLGSRPELWQVTDRSGEDIFKMSEPLDAFKSAPARETVGFLRHEATGRVSDKFVEAIRDPSQRERIVSFLLESEFPASTHEDVLSRVGIRLTEVGTPGRDPEFREMVLLAYEYKCAFCDFGAYLRGRPVSIDAAHIRMHAKQGPSVIENGVALCALHHRLFDSGAIGLKMQNDERKVLVSQHLNVLDDPSSRPLLALSGEPMRLPQLGYSPPDKDHIDWHYENLFKQPARN